MKIGKELGKRNILFVEGKPSEELLVNFGATRKFQSCK